MTESSKATEAASYAITASEAWDWNESQLAELNRHLDKPFGEVERFNQALAFTLWMDGHPIGRMTGGEWHECNPVWYRDARYCVLPKPEPLVLPSIDWSHVAPKWTWLAQDSSGSAFIHERMPVTETSTVWHGGGSFAHAMHFASFKPGTGDWKKLIVQRPEVKK